MAESGKRAGEQQNLETNLREAPHSLRRPGLLSLICRIVEAAADRSAQTTIQGALVGSIPGSVLGIVVAILGAIHRGPVTNSLVLGAFAILVIGMGGAILGALAGALLGWIIGVAAGVSAALLKSRLQASSDDEPLPKAALIEPSPGHLDVARAAPRTSMPSDAELACSGQETL